MLRATAPGGTSHAPRNAGPSNMTCLLFHAMKHVTIYGLRFSGFYRAISFRPLFHDSRRTGVVSGHDRLPFRLSREGQTQEQAFSWRSDHPIALRLRGYHL